MLVLITFNDIFFIIRYLKINDVKNVYIWKSYTKCNLNQSHTHTHTYIYIYIYKVEFKCGVTLSNVTPSNIFNLMWI